VVVVEVVAVAEVIVVVAAVLENMVEDIRVVTETGILVV
jgi:hypothetical protein